MTFPNFDVIKQQWAWGYMDEIFLGTYVKIGTITAAQFKEISGKDYVNE